MKEKNEGVRGANDLVATLVEHFFRYRSGQLVASLTRIFGVENIGLAEDVVQETLLKALRLWPFKGIPDAPSAWLTRVARNLAIDQIRRNGRLQEIAAEGDPAGNSWRCSDPLMALDDPTGDDQLTMIFLCCHPLLSQEVQTTLALRYVGGLGNSEIAQAFLVREEAIAQRIVRAKRKLIDADISFKLPVEKELGERIEAVLSVIYLLFNEGYLATAGESLVRREMCDEAVRLASIMASHPRVSRPEVHALLALMKFQSSRVEARVDPAGNLLLLSQQDWRRWDRKSIEEGLHHLRLAAAGEQLSTYHLLAGIASCHAVAETVKETDWNAVLFYYDELYRRTDSPIVGLNRTVAIMRVKGPEAGMIEAERLAKESVLQRYYLLPALLGEIRFRMGQCDDSIRDFERALCLTENKVEKRFIRRKLDEIWKEQERVRCISGSEMISTTRV